MECDNPWALNSKARAIDTPPVRSVSEPTLPSFPCRCLKVSRRTEAPRAFEAVQRMQYHTLDQQRRRSSACESSFRTHGRGDYPKRPRQCELRSMFDKSDIEGRTTSAQELYPELRQHRKYHDPVCPSETIISKKKRRKRSNR